MKNKIQVKPNEIFFKKDIYTILKSNLKRYKKSLRESNRIGNLDDVKKYNGIASYIEQLITELKYMEME